MMEFTELPLAGAYLVTPTRREDERGFFARSWCAREFGEHGLNPRLAQSSFALNPLRATIRGLHFQVTPRKETKLVSCVRGAIWDVIVDLRPDSETYRSWHAEVLDGENLRALYVPEDFAHGYLTLHDDTLVLYQVSEFHDAIAARGVRWDDPAFGIRWPFPPSVIGQRDRSYPDFDDMTS